MMRHSYHSLAPTQIPIAATISDPPIQRLNPKRGLLIRNAAAMARTTSAAPSNMYSQPTGVRAHGLERSGCANSI